LSTEAESGAELARETVVRLAAMIARREVSPVEVLEAHLSRVERFDPTLNAFLTVDWDGARATARAAEKAVMGGEDLGPLHGVPVGVKDLEDTADLRTTYGSSAYGANVPAADSILVERLRGAGAVIVGKTNTPAFGLLGETRNRLGDDARNPWDPDRTSGGSSGGSAAAVAAGMVAGATGTDSAGSITCPASMCGVFGIKPSFGRVPMHPDAGDSLTFNHGGPLARSVEDAALLLSAIAGHDPRDPVSLREGAPDFLASLAEPVADLRLAYSPDLGHFAVEREVREVTAAAALALGEAGHRIEQATPSVEDPWLSYTPIYLADARVGLQEILAEHADDLLPESIEELSGSERISGAEVARAWNHLHRFRAAMADFFSSYDVLLTPATAVTAFPVGEPPGEIGGREVQKGWKGFMPFAIPWNLTGRPAASVPCGFDSDGLPIGLMVVGRIGDEATVLRVAAEVERSQPAGTPLDRIEAR
jgi:Asp-tRNA(Asn)/Glu-tRNA(Gln) amidotransferase A subunit family amidase